MQMKEASRGSMLGIWLIPSTNHQTAVKISAAALQMPLLEGQKAREEGKGMRLKQERNRLPRQKPAGRQRTSRFTGVGSSNRKNQWQARILVHGKASSSFLCLFI